MSFKSTEALGSKPIPKLLIQQAVPASIGILVMSLNILIDTIFVGQWIGSNAIAAINVVLPVSFFIAALGMSIGVGGASIISRALGEGMRPKAERTFANQITLTLLLTVFVVVFGLLYVNEILPLFGGKGSLFSLAKTYYVIVMYGVPVLAFCMMSNAAIRAEGKPKNAMYAMLLPSVSNLLLDYIFIRVFDWGMFGAAWATTLSYGVCASYIVYFFLSKKSILRPKWEDFILDSKIVKEISSLGSVTLVRQAMVSLTVLLVNNILFSFGGESTIAVYAILSRMLMFLFFADQIPTLFSKDAVVNAQTPAALKYVFAALPVVGIQLIGAAYFQAVGKALPALLLTLSRQGLIFIPLLFILSHYYGVIGVWLAFPIADVISTVVTAYFLNRAVRKELFV